MRTILSQACSSPLSRWAAARASHPALRLSVTPVSSVEDQPIRIRFDGLEAPQGVWLELRSTDANGVVFVSRAAYGADEHGVLDVAHANALDGSTYSGVWAMGLLSEMYAPNALPLTAYHWGEHTTALRAVGGLLVGDDRFHHLRAPLAAGDVHDGDQHRCEERVCRDVFGARGRPEAGRGARDRRF